MWDTPVNKTEENLLEEMKHEQIKILKSLSLCYICASVYKAGAGN